MKKNKIRQEDRVHTPYPYQSSVSVNTQNNFLSVHQLSSVSEGQKNIPTISNIRRKYLMQGLINRLKFLIAPFISPPNFKQNWSQQYKPDQSDQQLQTFRQALLNQISYKYSFWHVLLIIQALCVVAIFWTSSTELVFLPKFQTQLTKNIVPLGYKIIFVFIILTKLVIKQILIFRQRTILAKMPQNSQTDQTQKQIQIDKNQQRNEMSCLNIKDILGSILQGLTCIFYLFLHFLDPQSLKQILLIFVVVVYFYKAWNLKQNIQKIYSYVQSKDYKNQFRIVVLFFLVLVVCHLIALVMYCLTYIYPDKNWISAVDKVAVKQNTWISHYVCSIYFTITTMATVGYGDFTPIQTGELFFVSLIQLFGSALFGYMINVVGLSVVQINKKNQQFDNHISTINKLQNHYQITRQLCQKFKNEIVKNQSVKKQTPLSQNEEIQFFKLVQNSLKQQFILQTNIKVIKKSIFFLTHFTVNFQNEIALKLIRKIYKKNQKVPLLEWDGQNAERCMLIINSGSVDIEIANQSSNIQMKKLIKSITPIQGKPTLNVFGYSALIMNKDIDLQATTKDTSVIYLLKRKDVLQCTDKNMLDFQGVCQIRQKMLNYKSINHIQAPSMLDIQKHFIPNVFFVNKRKRTVFQERQQDYKRSRRRCRIKVITMKNYQFRTMNCIDLQDQQSKSIQQIFNKSKLSAKGNQNQQNSANSIQGEFIDESNRENFISGIDQFKTYENFMKRSNINNLILKYHEYLRVIRKQRKLLQNVQQIEQQEAAKQKSFFPRIQTFTQGIKKKLNSHTSHTD